jgi:hypothetical protein
LQKDYPGLFPDLVNDCESFETFGQRTDFSQNIALLHSVAVIIKNLVETKGLDGPAFIIQNSVEIPGHIKDCMRANLPTFIKMFDYVSKFCDFLRNIIEGTKINVSRYSVDHFITRSYACASKDGSTLPSATGVAAAIAKSTIANDTCIIRRPVDPRKIIHPMYVVNAAASAVAPGTAYYLKEPVVKSDITEGMRRYITWNSFLDANAMPIDHGSAKNRFNAMITTLTTPIDIMQSTCRDVLRELVDDKVYLDLYDKFIVNYKAKNGGNLPIMPLSTVLYQLRNVSTDKTLDRLLPTTNVSDSSFKLYYGTRQVLLYNDKIDISKYPYVKTLVDNYNTAVSDNDKVSVEKYLNFMEKSITLVRYISDATFFKGFYGVGNRLHKAATAPEFATASKLYMHAATRLGDDIIPDSRQKLLVFQLQKTKDTTKVVDLSEAVDQKRTLENITKLVTVSSGEISDNRKQELRYNIIDLNMVPINPSALMREIPLTNIYNYSYTVENMLASMFGADPERISNLKLDNTKRGVPPMYGLTGNPPAPHTTGTTIGLAGTGATLTPLQPHGANVGVSVKDVFLKLLFNPYAAVSRNHIYGVENYPGGILAPLQRIFRGDNSLGLGTPKFLSDQLFNKVLFNSVYPRGTAAFDEEGGPIYSLGRLLDASDRNTSHLGDSNVIREYNPNAVNTKGAAMTMTFPYRDNRDKKNTFKIATIRVSGKLHELLVENGYDRFNTNVVRNMFFITNLYRVLRWKLNQELVQNRSMIISSNNLVNPSITEYGSSHSGHTEVFSDNAIDSTYRGMSS